MAFRFLIRCANLEVQMKEKRNADLDYKVVNALAKSFIERFEA